MEKYIYSDEQRSILEGMQAPFAVYQFLDRRVVTLILSNGFCELFGYDDRAQAYYDMDHDMYKDTHPDDAARIADAAFRFATEGGRYEVIYRTRMKDGSGYRVVHAIGTHVQTAEGVRLAHVWYTDEGSYVDGVPGEITRLNRAFNGALHEESMLMASHYDHLTGLPSMTYFFELAESGLAAIRETGAQPVLLYMDFSGMKYYNHKNGFAEGDKLLREFSQLLKGTFSNENCSRFGQDHFAVFTEEQGLEETLTRLFSQARSLHGGNSLPVRVGIYRCQAEDVAVSMACDRAKIACDAIRKTYGSCFNYFREDLRNDIKRRQYIQSNLDRAIDERWIQVYYQPIIRAANGKVCGDESLARWIDPEEGLLPPGEFIPYLEDSGQIYQLDLYVLEQVLETVRTLREAGRRSVPHSINLSRSDFDACDIVEEIRARVDAAGVRRDQIAIEITESTIGSDFERMKDQIARFRELGFPVWLDDFGSGYSSLDALQSIRFDLIKFDMSFMRKLNENDSSRVVLTELMKLATSLGADTLCEGVETKEQVRFLQEIGCSRLQGYYFGKPLPLDRVLHAYSHPRFGYENREEVPYYEAIGRLNLYDLSMIGSESESGIRNYFNALPMGIIEVKGSTSRFVRSNQSYRDFVKRFLGFDLSREGTDFMPYDDGFVVNVVKTCCEQGIRSYYDQTLPSGAVVHSLARRVAVNPVDGTVAVVVAVLSITSSDEGTTYESIARALAADYYNIYCVDLETEHFIEYSSVAGRESLAIERHGEHFFESAKRDTMTRLYEEDRELFLRIFTKENIVRELDAQGVFSVIYRLIDTGKPIYVNMKVTRMQPGRKQIIIGISVVDAQVKQKELLDAVKKEKESLARAMALSEDYLSIYMVDPDTGQYVEFSASNEYRSLGVAMEGTDFFQHGRDNIDQVICPEDLSGFLQSFTKENILRTIRTDGAYQLQYRLMINGTLKPVTLRIAAIRESGREKLVAGIRAWKARRRSAPAAFDPGTPDFQEMVNRLAKPCAILSVERGQDGTAGEIRIVCANREYKTAMGSRYYDNMPYHELVPKFLQFEYSCYRCAFGQQQIHTYVQTKVDNLWTDQQLIPLHSDREDLGYCQFVLELSKMRDREQMAAVSIRTSSVVLRAAITLLGTNDLKERVKLVLKDIMEFSEAFSVRVMLVDHENKRAINYCDVMSVPVPADAPLPEDDPDQAVISYPLLCSWEDTLGESSALVVTTKRELDELEPRNPVWVKTLRAYGVTSLILIPLRHDHEITGYLYLCNFASERVNEVRELMELMSFFLGTEIYNEVLLSRLDEMSHTDSLTGLKNRNAMIQRTKEIVQNRDSLPFGVVNLDLNGLKAVNDYQGHDAGDRLLVSAAEILRKYFYAGDLYRTGGDEFIVIATGITESAFRRKVERLREATRKQGGVSFAIGAYWSDGSTDVLHAFRRADENMYADKKAFYDKHPEQKR